ncbi:unnamed protein product (macronuclear) [Paramecium tetraurelia]|uniref:Uncharacterized protein n=1 Tax=Paramecium tetraurelia TaxID=5888 RepID=A0D992_PARTE|nr:uncharacterized protein GSPATT00014539001 [Paramecium tetraurelia]CAK79609.1 unnamed protein product [Paramecium tetraurelia]|eukprot:XP_001447006.1 hypothetical protein (macronuclear) [Paramecium tetraurelia strain d4-2]
MLMQGKITNYHIQKVLKMDTSPSSIPQYYIRMKNVQSVVANLFISKTSAYCLLKYDNNNQGIIWVYKPLCIDICEIWKLTYVSQIGKLQQTSQTSNFYEVMILEGFRQTADLLVEKLFDQTLCIADADQQDVIQLIAVDDLSNRQRDTLFHLMKDLSITSKFRLVVQKLTNLCIILALLHVDLISQRIQILVPSQVKAQAKKLIVSYMLANGYFFHLIKKQTSEICNNSGYMIPIQLQEGKSL